MSRKKGNKSNGKVKLSILVPVYNEEKTLEEILKRTLSLPIDRYEVLIVDDASKDKSPEMISKYKKQHKDKNVVLKSFRHKVNKGKGAAIQTGLKHAVGEYFVIQDADLEYSPEDIPKLLSAAYEGGYMAVYGSRFMGDIKNMPKANYIANRGYNFIVRLLYRVKITDMHTCYKMVNTALLKELGIRSNGFDYATELISKLLKRKVHIYEIPINFNGRTKKEGKKISTMDGVECAYKLLRFRFSKSEKLFSEKSTTFWRFIIVGGLGFVVNYLILVALTELRVLSHVPAEAIAAAFALQVTFLLHDRWTYLLHTPKGTTLLSLKARYISYLTSNAFGSLMTVFAFGVLHKYLIRIASLLLAAIFGLIWNYLMNTYVIWRKRTTLPDEA